MALVIHESHFGAHNNVRLQRYERCRIGEISLYID